MERPIVHERVPLLGRIRAHLRARFFELLHRTARTDDGRSILHGSLAGAVTPPALLGLDPDAASPYPELGRASSGAGARDDVVIISGRFRSGSTLLWNLLREVPSCTAFYEPFNERRWFDPGHRQGHVDATHRGVSDYWREYDQLEKLGAFYEEEWNDRRLFMDEHSFDPQMKAFVDTLIDTAPGRPVLQFNRIDFRLPWFRKHYPGATILHLYRHPRDAWLSSLVDPTAHPAGASLDAFERVDHFYLLRWARDLRHDFPILEPSLHDHAYDLYYLIWKLSYLFGRRYAHHSVSFEDLAIRPAEVVPTLFHELRVRDADLDHVVGLVDPPKIGKWRRYADDDWFAAREARAESLLADFLGRATLSTAPRDAASADSGLALI